MSNCGHGWVYPNSSGVKARCGGPALCSKCAADLADAKSYGTSPYLEILMAFARRCRIGKVMWKPLPQDRVD